MHLEDKSEAYGVKTFCDPEQKLTILFSAGSRLSRHTPLKMIRNLYPSRQQTARRSPQGAGLALLCVLLGLFAGASANAQTFPESLRPNHLLRGEEVFSERWVERYAPQQAQPRHGSSWPANRAPRAFHGVTEEPEVFSQNCVPEGVIRQRLRQQGWWDLQGLRRSGENFMVRARRPNGSSYQLTIDGCSGGLLEAMRLNEAQPGSRLWPR